MKCVPAKISDYKFFYHDKDEALYSEDLSITLQIKTAFRVGHESDEEIKWLGEQLETILKNNPI